MGTTEKEGSGVGFVRRIGAIMRTESQEGQHIFTMSSSHCATARPRGISLPRGKRPCLMGCLLSIKASESVKQRVMCGVLPSRNTNDFCSVEKIIPTFIILYWCPVRHSLVVYLI